MAEAGRFMTKCEMVEGTVIVVGGSLGAEVEARREVLGWIVMMLVPEAARDRRESAA